MRCFGQARWVRAAVMIGIVIGMWLGTGSGCAVAGAVGVGALGAAAGVGALGAAAGLSAPAVALGALVRLQPEVLPFAPPTLRDAFALDAVRSLAERLLSDALQSGRVVRLQVVAADDTLFAQRTKLAARDAILAALAESGAAFCGADTVYAHLSANAADYADAARNAASRAGFAGRVTAEVGTFAFPAKSYGRVVLPAGRYRALRVTLGRGQGRNWWCLLAPSLCYAAAALPEDAGATGAAALPENAGATGAAALPENAGSPEAATTAATHAASATTASPASSPSDEKTASQQDAVHDAAPNAAQTAVSSPVSQNVTLTFISLDILRCWLAVPAPQAR